MLDARAAVAHRLLVGSRVPSTPTTKSRVLLVDPDPAAGVVLAMLGSVCSVTICGHASDALVQLRAAPPDLVISAASLPDLDVVTFVRGVRAKLDCRIVVLTDDPLLVRELSEVGLDGYFATPLRLDPFLHHVYALCAVPGPPPRPHVTRALEHIAAAYASRLTPRAVAAALAVSPRHLAHVFKADTGLTLMAFVARVRVEVARRWLATSEATLTRIAAAVGFAGAPTLSRAFRRHAGDRPGRYRRGQRSVAR